MNELGAARAVPKRNAMQQQQLDDSTGLDAKELRAWWQSVLSLEMTAELPWRSAALCCVTAGAGVLAGWGEMHLTGLPAGLWSAFVVLELFLHYRLLYERDTRSIYFLTIFSTLVMLPCLVLLPSLGAGRPGFSAALVPLFILATGSIPWSWSCNVFITIFLALTALAWLPFSVIPGLFLIASMTSLIIAFRMAAVHYQALLTRCSLSFLTNYCEYVQHSKATMRALAWQLAGITGAPRSVVLYQDASSEVVAEAVSHRCSASALIVRGFMQAIRDKRQEQGILALDEFGPQYTAALVEWFVRPPRRIFFLRFTALLDGTEQAIAILVPVGKASVVCGIGRSMRSLLAASAIVRASLAAIKSRLLSSDALLFTQEAISEREREFNELVHLINNIAQNITAQCDALRGSAAAPEVLAGRIELLEGSAQVLSSTVSDAKLLRELAELRDLPATEETELLELIEEIAEFGQRYAEQHGRRFSLAQNLAQKAIVRVPGRDYLRAVLRTLMRQVIRLPDTGTVLQLAASQVSDTAVIDIGCWDGARLDVAAATSAPEDGLNDKQIPAAAALRQLATACGGAMQIHSNPVLFRLHLPVYAENRVSSKRAAKWILFIDDSPEVLTFYARVSEALRLPCSTAASCEEARRLVAEKGAPGLVVTDLQLAGEQALGLVSDLRQRYGSLFPIIVVSGKSDSQAAESARNAGATHYLTKPLGRRRLFHEIQSVLK